MSITEKEINIINSVDLEQKLNSRQIKEQQQNSRVEELLRFDFLPHRLRNALWASFVVGTTAFACPGIFGALNGLGAGGGADETTANVANAITFGTIAVGGFLTGSITNQIGVKQALIIGASFYSPYAAAMYVTNYHPGNKWFMPFSAFVLGVSAAFLWIASGAILLGYSDQQNKGKAMSIKFSLQHLGASIGGMIALGMNHEKTSSRKISKASYLVLTFFMLIGIPFAVFLPTPSQITKNDGSKVLIRKQPSIWKEFGLLGKILKQREVLLLLPLFLYNQWYLSFQWSINARHFTLRGRALNSFLFYVFGMIGAWFAGLFLDNPRLKRSMRARYGFFIANFFAAFSWIYGLILTDKWKNNVDYYDWNTGGYGLGCFLYIIWGFMDAAMNTYVYWIVGGLSDNVNELSLLSGVINGIGSVGSAMAFCISAKKVNPVAQCAINLGLYFLSVPTSLIVAWEINDKEAIFARKLHLVDLQYSDSLTDETEKTSNPVEVENHRFIYDT